MHMLFYMMSLSYCHIITHTANPAHINWLPQGLCFLIRYELQQLVAVQKWSIAKAEWCNLHTASSWVQGQWSSRPGMELQECVREWHSAAQMVRGGKHSATLVVFCIYLMSGIDKRKFPWPSSEGQAIPRGSSGSCGVLKFTVTSLQVKCLTLGDLPSHQYEKKSMWHACRSPLLLGGLCNKESVSSY